MIESDYYDLGYEEQHENESDGVYLNRVIIYEYMDICSNTDNLKKPWDEIKWMTARRITNRLCEEQFAIDEQELQYILDLTFKEIERQGGILGLIFRYKNRY